MDLLISKKNEVYLKVEAEPHLNYELADFFTFEVESAKFMQKKRRYKGWDGKIRLYSPATGERVGFHGRSFKAIPFPIDHGDDRSEHNVQHRRSHEERSF